MTAENWAEWYYPTGKVTPGRIVDLMRRYPNLYGDISAWSGYTAMMRDPEFTYDFLEEFQDQILFGTDISDKYFDLGLSVWLDEAVKNGKISDGTYRKIGRDNALRLLKIE